MAQKFSASQWQQIRSTLEENPTKYGLPQREYGSVVLASFNIRKLGAVSKRRQETWDFLAYICRHFDLLSVQEIQDELSGFEELKVRMGDEFAAVVSDRTGVFPGERGLGERLGFIYNSSLIRRGDVVSDISIDRSRLLATIVEHHELLYEALAPYARYLEQLERWKNQERSSKPKKPKVKTPVFLSFIRQPFCASFQAIGHPGTAPYEFMAVNAHLYFGNSVHERRQEFEALMDWILGRVSEKGKAYYPNFLLLGDLNLDFDNPQTDRQRIEEQIKTFDDRLGGQVNVNFPFLDAHPTRSEPFRTNARLTETFDQIGLFSRDERLPSYKENAYAGSETRGFDYGVFNFVELFCEALYERSFDELTQEKQKEFFRLFEHEVSDHLPLWLRLPLPSIPQPPHHEA